MKSHASKLTTGPGYRTEPSVARLASQQPQLRFAPVVDTELCTGCGDCLQACMFEAIKLGATAEIVEERCGACGACIVDCQTRALHWPR